MAKLNTSKKVNEHVTHEGAVAKRIDAEAQLRRSVMACLLWENSFYEDGESIADRILETIAKVEPKKVAEIAIEAREKMKLRHVPLLIVRQMAKLPTHKSLVSETLSRVIQRADELTEFLAIYWKNGREKLSGQVKKGLAKAFPKFSAYDLAKYNQDGAVKLRDVLFLCHAKPKDEEQAEVWKKLIAGTLESPDTWEVSLSAGKDKKETWERLIAEKKLGALAYLRNLRNMKQANVSDKVVKDGLKELNVKWALPFRFITAARYAPNLEPELEQLLFKSCAERTKLKGVTIILIDVSGSMDSAISNYSEVNRIEAACGVAIVAREICESVEVFTFSEKIVQVPARRGFALRDAIHQSQPHSSTYLGAAVEFLNKKECDRLIVFTDEQSADQVPGPKMEGYMVNVAAYKNGVGYGKWTHLDGFSEAILDYIGHCESPQVVGS